VALEALREGGDQVAAVLLTVGLAVSLADLVECAAPPFDATAAPTTTRALSVLRRRVGVVKVFATHGVDQSRAACPDCEPLEGRRSTVLIDR
jgi:hypothetical protein